MIIRLLVCAAVLLSNGLLVAQNARFVTLTHTNGAPSSTLSILAGETAELISMSIAANLGGTYVIARKDGMNFLAFPASAITTATGVASGVGTTVAGPAVFTLNESGQSSVYATFKISVQAYDINKTIILPASDDQFQVTMETSTNLVNWISATNGVYGSPLEARFFRIKMDKTDVARQN